MKASCPGPYKGKIISDIPKKELRQSEWIMGDGNSQLQSL
jgi:hypothetical protein